MRRTTLIISIILGLFLVGSVFSQGKLYGTVTEVIDGKTIIVYVPEGIRITLELQYIEIPEAGQPLRSTVRDHLQKLVLNQRVMFEPNGMASDKTVGQVFLNGVDISQQMIRDGAAWHSISEKKNQNEIESVAYQNNQAQAKDEKRGVWSVEGLKPAWEFRADQAEKKRLEKVRKIREMQEKAKAQLAAHPKPKKERAKPAANLAGGFGIETWSRSPKSYAQKLGGYDDLYYGKTAQNDASFIVTDQNFPVVKVGKVSQKIDLRTMYISKGELYNPHQHAYFIAILSSSKNYRFLKSNSLTLYVDGKKMHMARTVRLYRPEAEGVGELLLIRTTKQQLKRIAKARKVRMKVGNYSGGVTNGYSDMLTELLDATK